ncbi:Lipopolysaccharide core biosynthesis protein RfaG [Candidatus Magnetaquicoccaceae bacterium FCR-1]|uniref:Lipopolysaccharide core biosynthesis protein RfaG n=1 Tax=Candidatus Magnetaquiglobus chichijimensis TaxID=3141448 RepID=A0ABQ0C5P7_9PROT
MTGDREMRLALIRQRHTPFGGAERFLDRAMGALRARGVAITLIARRWEGGCDGLETVRCDPWHLGRWWRDVAFARCVHARLAERRFDLVQSHERIPGCDLYRAGDGVHAEWLEQRGRARGRVARWLDGINPFHRHLLNQERLLFEHADLKAVICNSRMVRAEILARFRIAPEKLVVIYSGVDLERFHPETRARERDAARAGWGIAPHETLLLFVGSGFERKGVPALLTALAGLDRATRLVVVGRDKAQGRMEGLARRLGVADRVLFTGGRRDVVPCYAAADAVVLPTLYDPFPNVALEAMAMGLPLVTTFKCGAVDLIDHGVNGLLGDALDLATLTRNLQSLDDAAYRVALGRAARETVVGLSLETMSARLMELYQGLLTRGAGC